MDRVRRLIGLEGMKEWENGSLRGRGVGVAILDSGLCVEHPDLRGRVAAFRNFVGSRQDCHDDNGHGTHVAGIVGGAAVG